MSGVEIAGRYRLESRLGFGGMSTVHLALDLRLERQVAVKLLAEHLAEDPAFVSRFQREAQAAARLVHPNIVQVFDSGRDERTGQYFIVMEYIEGSSCAEILRDDGWVEVDEALSIIEQACEGLRLRAPPRRRAPRRQARQPAARARRRGQAGRLRHRQGHRAVEHHAGRLGARHRRLPRARAGPRRGGRPERRPVRARRRHLPADLRAPALRGDLADRAGAQAAAGATADARHAGRRGHARAGRGGRDRAGARPARPLQTRRWRWAARCSDGARGIAPRAVLGPRAPRA